MAVSNVVQVGGGRKQFQGLFEHVVEYEALVDPASVGSNSFEHEVLDIKGAKFGDFVMVSFEADLQELTLEGHVSAADQVDLHFINNTAGAIDLPEAQVHIVLLRPIHLHPN